MQTARRMFRLDLWRGGAQGVLETCWQTFALLVLIRVFAADESVKRNVPAAFGYGLLLSPLVLPWLSRLRWRTSHFLAALWAGVALALLAAAWVPRMGVFLGAVVFCQLLLAQGMPLQTHLYSTNYPVEVRGRRLSLAVVVGSVVGMVFGFAGGLILDLRPETLGTYPLIFTLAAVAAAVAGLAVFRMPSGALALVSAGSLLSNLKMAWRDWVFRWLLLAWMVMGLSNLMLIPIRVEYLANERYGINASNAEIAVLMAMVVPGFRLVSTYAWGWIFDRFNLITVRVVLNLFFLGSMYLFFFTTSLWVMGAGAALLGIAFGGGNIMWTLWVTKIAPPEKVASYVSVHGFFTGLRSAIAPIIGYTLLEASGPRVAAGIAMGLLVVSIFMFLPLRSIIGRYEGGRMVAPG